MRKEGKGRVEVGTVKNRSWNRGEEEMKEKKRKEEEYEEDAIG